MIALPVLSGQDCPRFNSCNAAVCPLDPSWRGAAHLPGEKTCFYLLASDKAGAAERFAADPIFAAVLEVATAVCARHAAIARAVEAAAKSGFQGDNLRPKHARDSGFPCTDTGTTASEGIPPVEPALFPIQIDQRGEHLRRESGAGGDGSPSDVRVTATEGAGSRPDAASPMSHPLKLASSRSQGTRRASVDV